MEMNREHVADWMVGIFGLSDSRGSIVPWIDVLRIPISED
jgi:hypothetical protein